MHGRVENVSCTTSSSYVPVQIFEHHGLVFGGIARSRPYRGLACFAQLPPSAFLINLDRAPKDASAASLSLEIVQMDFAFLVVTWKGINQHWDKSRSCLIHVLGRVQ